MLLITIYALIGDDIRLLAFEKEADDVFMWLNILAFGLFTLELILSSIGVDKYFGSFFFWLDLISTLSIILDIEPMTDAIINLGKLDENTPSKLVGTMSLDSICST